MVSSVADILSGCGQSHRSLLSRSPSYDLKSRRMPLKPPRWAAASPADTPQASRYSGSEVVGDIVQPWNFQLHRDGLTGIARLHLECYSGRRLHRCKGEKIGSRITETCTAARCEAGQAVTYSLRNTRAIFSAFAPVQSPTE